MENEKRKVGKIRTYNPKGRIMRYVVEEGSSSSHCCFEASVVDTATPHPVYEDKPRWVCECFDKEDAERIAKALNLTETLKGLKLE